MTRPKRQRTTEDEAVYQRIRLQVQTERENGRQKAPYGQDGNISAEEKQILWRERWRQNLEADPEKYALFIEKQREQMRKSQQRVIENETAEQKEKRKELARMNYWKKKEEKTKPPALDEDGVKALAEALQGIKLVSLSALLGNMERY